jgi:dihydropteroate synthase
LDRRQGGASRSRKIGQGVEGDIARDPGIGLGKNTARNPEPVNRMDAFEALGFPILGGPDLPRSFGPRLA